MISTSTPAWASSGSPNESAQLSTRSLTRKAVCRGSDGARIGSCGVGMARSRNGPASCGPSSTTVAAIPSLPSVSATSPFAITAAPLRARICLQRFQIEVVGVAVGDDDGRDVAECLRRDQAFDEGVRAGVEEEFFAFLLEEQARMEVLGNLHGSLSFH